jgi:hypothetical protein
MKHSYRKYLIRIVLACIVAVPINIALIILLSAPLDVTEDTPLPNITEGIVTWDTVTNSMQFHEVVGDVQYGVPDSVYVFVADTTGDIKERRFVIIRNVYDGKDTVSGDWRIVNRWQTSYVRPGVYWMWVKLWYPHGVYISGITLQEFTPLQLVEPQHEEFGVSRTPVLVWQDPNRHKHVPHPEVEHRFELQIARDKQFTTIVHTVFTDDTLYTVADSVLKVDGKYYWRVRAWNVAGAGQWSGR